MKLRDALIILACFTLLKLYHCLILFIIPSQFDLSSISQPIIPTFPTLDLILNNLIHWDSIYMSKLIQHDIKFEHEWAMSPFWWRFIRFLYDYVELYLNITPLLLAFIVSNLSQLLSSFILFELTEALFAGSNISLKSSILFLFSSMGIFGSNIYAENLNTLFVFIGLYLKLSSSSIVYVLSSIFFVLAFITRANSIVLGSLYLWDLFHHGTYKSFISGHFLGYSVILFHIFPYHEFCMDIDDDLIRPWCLNTIPSIYSFVQTTYWNVGFLRYWTLGNIPNFLLGLPEILLLFKSSLHFMKSSSYLKSLSYMNILYLILVLGFFHVQIVLRISTFIPLQFWYLSSLIVNNEGKFWIYWLVTWNLVEPILFAAFLPPA